MLNDTMMKVRKQDAQLRGCHRLEAAWNWGVELLKEMDMETVDIRRLENAEKYMTMLLEEGIKNRHLFYRHTEELRQKNIAVAEATVEYLRRVIAKRGTKPLFASYFFMPSIGIFSSIHMTPV